MRSSLHSVVLLLLVLSGCSSSKLTCGLLKDDSNCWAEAALATSECLPSGEVGLLSADRTSCTFSGGARVVFDAPLPTDDFGLTNLDELGVTLERSDGTTCARFVDTHENRQELTAGGDVVVTELHSGTTFHLHCGDGHTYETSFDSLIACASDGTTPLPSGGVTVTPESVDFRVASVATPDTIFRCTTTGL
jgi:hypothetical protein